MGVAKRGLAVIGGGVAVILGLGMGILSLEALVADGNYFGGTFFLVIALALVLNGLKLVLNKPLPPTHT